MTFLNIPSPKCRYDPSLQSMGMYRHCSSQLEESNLDRGEQHLQVYRRVAM